LAWPANAFHHPAQVESNSSNRLPKSNPKTSHPQILVCHTACMTESATPDTLFSKIVRREIPAHIVAEDDLTLAFLDIFPASLGHTLIVSKNPFPDLFSADPNDLAAVARMSKHVADLIMAAFAPAGLNVLQNNRAVAGQEVFHYHIHLIPRYENDEIKFRVPRAPEMDLALVAAQLRGEAS
jgi:histidine triad (HIT) family protein